jgi:hypothetical protein
MLTMSGCSAVHTQPAKPATSTPQLNCLRVSDKQEQAISAGVERGISLTDFAALPAETGPGAWFVVASANGPGIDNDTFVFFTAADPENFTGGITRAADSVTAEFVSWPKQEGAMADGSYGAVQRCTR